MHTVQENHGGHLRSVIDRSDICAFCNRKKYMMRGISGATAAAGRQAREGEGDNLVLDI